MAHHQKHGPAASQLLGIIEDPETAKMRRIAMRLLMQPAFDTLMGVVILFNLAVMVIETNNAASSQESSDNSISWTGVCGWIVLVVFIVELMLRIFALQCLFWKDAWNVFDFMIVLVDAIFSLVGLVIGDAFPISILRIFRLAKLARVSKVLRVFPELRVLLVGLVGSARAIFWGMILLTFCVLVFSMVGVLFIDPLAKSLEVQQCVRCHSAYSSVQRAMLSLWDQMVIGDSWPTIVMPLMEAYPGTLLFFIPSYMIIGMSVVNLVLGVVVQVALSAKEEIQRDDDTDKKLVKMETETHLLDLCHQMDFENSGHLSKEIAFAKFQEPGDFRNSILAMDVTEEDFSIIWTIIDPDNKGHVPLTELVSRLYSIRSSDTEFMLAYIKYYITLIRNDLLQTMQKMEYHLEQGMHKVEDEVHEIEEIEEQSEVGMRKFQAKEAQLVAAEKQLCGAGSGAWEAFEQNVHKVLIRGGLPEASQKTSPATSIGKSSHAPLATAGVANSRVVQASAQDGSCLASSTVTRAESVRNKQICPDTQTRVQCGKVEMI